MVRQSILRFDYTMMDVVVLVVLVVVVVGVVVVVVVVVWVEMVVVWAEMVVEVMMVDHQVVRSDGVRQV